MPPLAVTVCKKRFTYYTVSAGHLALLVHRHTVQVTKLSKKNPYVFTLINL